VCETAAVDEDAVALVTGAAVDRSCDEDEVSTAKVDEVDVGAADDVSELVATTASDSKSPETSCRESMGVGSVRLAFFLAKPTRRSSMSKIE
jgi:hypothetical protein